MNEISIFNYKYWVRYRSRFRNSICNYQFRICNGDGRPKHFNFNPPTTTNEKRQTQKEFLSYQPNVM